MNNNQSRAVAAALLLCAALTVTACGREERWCEEDATDTRVPLNFCEDGISGYEWEPDHDRAKTTTRTAPPRTSNPASTAKPSAPATKPPAASPAPKPTTRR